MLISWKSVYGETTLPTLTSLNTMNANWMVVVYGVCLLLCLISTAVTTTFGFVARFENIRVFKECRKSSKEKNYCICLYYYCIHDNFFSRINKYY